MVSSQLRHYVEGFEEIIHQDATDFSTSGLKAASVVRVGRWRSWTKALWSVQSVKSLLIG
jgi:hypothetical protein